MMLKAKLQLCQSCLWCCRSRVRLLCYVSTHRKPVSYYNLLGVKSDATVEEIKKAFFDKSKKLHPDSDPSNPALHSQFVELNEAYRVLSKEPSRKEYDFKVRHRYTGGQASTSTDSHNIYKTSADTKEHNNYWEQFHQSPRATMTAQEKQKRRNMNYLLVGYCVLTMVLSLGAHMIFFRKLDDIHTNYMDEKDRVITQIYNDSKEKAKVNGFKKQTEILRQKQAEFLEKYKNPNSGVAK
ncbi:dnaJ homolog subfamily C member 4 [Solea solea]|uniref:dnaJ homolog subfamily C member 4 n=1 Tax=Solea solea TaxID=90069 RepID=UPI00272AC42B|nr:dnaJ homolog subfamily C member 4 [Solea solea]XP_058506351.1 dnaJ homolog subfamily C member 4 [Solea solea]XP_058506352.1 dnaJ homolog subfamily C member 4 [Solea solea]XP_058506354.1 dnaJ homolog subfamily C member 4 [Solea solea]XP_058506355.1 dnaJ homolog subfamily C member 4 [Solea solea]